MAGVMVSLAVLYAAQDAPFLFVVQIIVYTGAILMLFLFVVMLVGVDATDSVVETHQGSPRRLRAGGPRPRRPAGAAAVGQFAVTAPPPGLTEANAEHGGNIQSLAALLFTRYVFIFEATAALLITAAVGAMILAHGEQLSKKASQTESAARNASAPTPSDGVHPGPLPSSGVFARHNAISTPALLPDGSVAEKSVSKTLAMRGVIVDVNELRAPTTAAYAAIAGKTDEIEGDDE